MQKKRIVVVSTDADISSVAATIIKQRLFEGCDLTFIRHDMYNMSGAVRFISRRIKRYGLKRVCNECALRVYLKLFGKKILNSKDVQFDYSFKEINSDLTIRRIQEINPDVIVAVAPGIFSKEFISSMPCSIINIHNGITPRYRGTGNIWALHEGNYDQVGVTIHEIDEGIDTGSILAQSLLDLSRPSVNIQNIDMLAFIEGANLVCDVVEEKKVPKLLYKHELHSKFYSFPGLTHYLTARKNFRNFSRGVRGNDEVWYTSFLERSKDVDLSDLDSMHWTNHEATQDREKHIIELAQKMTDVGGEVLDLGCGVGRYSKTLADAGRMITAVDYVGDFFPKHVVGRNPHYSVQNVYDLDCDDGKYDLVLAVGLFQHLSNPQRAIDEMARVVTRGGLVILNTLKQPPNWVLLAAIMYYSVVDRDAAAISLSILKKTYKKSVSEVGGTELARRYLKNELARMTGRYFTIENVCYDHRERRVSAFARELTLVLKRK